MPRPTPSPPPLLLTAALVLAACGDDLAKPGVIANLRIVGVQAEPPEAPPGVTVELASLVLSPDATAAIERVWAACVIARGQSAAGCVLPAGGALPPLCAADPEAPLCVIGGSETASYTLPQRALAGRGPGETGQVIITLLAAATADGGASACTAALEDPAAAPESCRVAVKRVNVLPEPSAAANANPRLAGFARDGDTLIVSLEGGAVETTAEGPEALFLSWYVTGGELEKFRTDADAEGLSNVWTPPTEPGSYGAAVVVRDGRGGESWQVTTLSVPAP